MKKKNLSTIALVLVFFVGLSVLLYPTISDYWNSLHQSQAIATYADSVAEMDEQDYEEMWNAAQEYNEKLFETGHGLGLKKKEKKEYNNLLNVSGTGIMSYIEIPKIKCSLPIYHGTDEGVLQIAIGHIEGSSLPVGGVNTHCVLSGHRGLPSAKLFSNLDNLNVFGWGNLICLNHFNILCSRLHRTGFGDPFCNKIGKRQNQHERKQRSDQL